MKYIVNGTELTQETILKTREHFRDICMGCIEEAKSGKVYVNDLEAVIQWETKSATEYMEGKHDYVLTFLQRAYWIQTGEMPALLG